MQGGQFLVFLTFEESVQYLPVLIVFWSHWDLHVPFRWAKVWLYILLIQCRVLRSIQIDHHLVVVYVFSGSGLQ